MKYDVFHVTAEEIYLKEGIEVESQKKLSKEWSSLAPSKPATSKYRV